MFLRTVEISAPVFSGFRTQVDVRALSSLDDLKAAVIDALRHFISDELGAVFRAGAALCDKSHMYVLPVTIRGITATQLEQVDGIARGLHFSRDLTWEEVTDPAVSIPVLYLCCGDHAH